MTEDRPTLEGAAAHSGIHTGFGREEMGDELSFGARMLYRVLRRTARLLTLVYWRAELHGRHNLPRTGAVIVAPVHRSNLDVPLVGATCARRLRYLAKDSLYRNRAIAALLTTLGGFPLRRGSADREALRASQEVLARGEPLVVFPEGERKAGPRVHPVFDGAMWLSAKTGAPILPVGIGGTARSLPIGSNFARPTKLVFVYGELIEAPSVPGGGRVPREVLRARGDELREVLQDLYDEAQARAGCPNPVRPPDVAGDGSGAE